MPPRRPPPPLLLLPSPESLRECPCPTCSLSSASRDTVDGADEDGVSKLAKLSKLVRKRASAECLKVQLPSALSCEGNVCLARTCCCTIAAATAAAAASFPTLPPLPPRAPTAPPPPPSAAAAAAAAAAVAAAAAAISEDLRASASSSLTWRWSLQRWRMRLASLPFPLRRSNLMSGCSVLSNGVSPLSSISLTTACASSPRPSSESS
jgi:hypothetical protein